MSKVLQRCAAMPSSNDSLYRVGAGLAMAQTRQASPDKTGLKLIFSQDSSEEVIIPIGLKEFPQRVSFFVKKTLLTPTPVRCQKE